MSKSGIIQYCPVCSTPMELTVIMDHNSDELEIARCPNCCFGIVVDLLNDDNVVTTASQQYLRLLLEYIVMGEEAKRVIGDLPFFPGNRRDRIISIMKSNISSGLRPKTEKSMSTEDIDLVIKALDL